MRNGRYEVHEDVGTDGLEVEEHSVDDAAEEVGPVEAAPELAVVYHEQQGGELHDERCEGRVILHLGRAGIATG